MHGNGLSSPSLEDYVQVGREESDKVDIRIQEPLKLIAIPERDQAAGFPFHFIVAEREYFSVVQRFPEVAANVFDAGFISVHHEVAGWMARV
jgi:hypothetical protein